MVFSFTPFSLFSEGPTAEHIEYALPTTTDTTDTSTSPNITYHHIQHFLSDGTPGASSTHIEYADQYNPSSSFSLSTPIFNPRRPTITTTRPRREQGTRSPSTSSTSTSSTTSPSRSPSIHVRFAGDLPLPLRSSPSPPQATERRGRSPSRSTGNARPRLHRNRASSPYPFVPSAAQGRRETDLFAEEEEEEEFGQALRSSRSEGDGEASDAASSIYARATTVARTAFVDREEVWDESGFLFGEEEEVVM